MDDKYINDCDIVQDLLPLYYDNVCSGSARNLVERHLKSCSDCREKYEELRNHTIENSISEETNGVLKRHAKKERTAAVMAGSIIAGLLLIPIVVTFFTCVIYGNDAGTFLIVIASLFLAAALTVVPLLSKKNKLVRTGMLSFAALLLILLFADMAGGGGNFALWAVPTIFGVSSVLLPLLIRKVKLPVLLSDKKGLIVMAWDTIWLFLTIIVVNMHYGTMQALYEGCTVTAIMAVWAWGGFFAARYLPANRWIKGGIITAISTFACVLSNDIWLFVTEGGFELTVMKADFSVWTTNEAINANVYAITLIIGLAAAVIMIIIGIQKRRK